MILIVYLWLAYFNTIVPNAASSCGADVCGGQQRAGCGEGRDIWSFCGCGKFVLAGASAMAREESLSDMKNPKQYNISPR